MQSAWYVAFSHFDLSLAAAVAAVVFLSLLMLLVFPLFALFCSLDMRHCCDERCRGSTDTPSPTV